MACVCNCLFSLTNENYKDHFTKMRSFTTLDSFKKHFKVTHQNEASKLFNINPKDVSGHKDVGLFNDRLR